MKHKIKDLNIDGQFRRISPGSFRTQLAIIHLPGKRCMDIKLIYWDLTMCICLIGFLEYRCSVYYDTAFFIPSRRCLTYSFSDLIIFIKTLEIRRFNQYKQSIFEKFNIKRGPKPPFYEKNIIYPLGSTLVDLIYFTQHIVSINLVLRYPKVELK